MTTPATTPLAPTAGAPPEGPKKPTPPPLPLAKESVIDNPVLPPDLGDFMASRRNKDRSTKEAPKVEAPKVEPRTPILRAPKAEEAPKPAEEAKPTEVAGDTVVDDDTDPLIASMLGGKPEEKKPAGEKPAAEKSGEADDVEDLPEGKLKGREDQVRSAFVAQKKKLTAKIHELETKLAEVEKGGATPEAKAAIEKYEKENTTLKKQVEDQEKFVQMANLEMSQTFEQQVKVPKEAIKQDILRIARDNGGVEAGVSANEIYQAVRSGDRKELSTIIGKLDEASRVEVVTLAKEFQNIQGTEKTLRENSKVALEEFHNAKQAEAKAMHEKVKSGYEKQLDGILEDFKKKNPAMFSKDAGGEDWKEAVEAADAFTTRLRSKHPSELTVQDVAAMAAFTRQVPLLELANAKLLAEVTRLKSRLGQKYKATPGAGGSGGSKPAAPSSNGEIPEPGAYFEGLRSRKR